MEEELRQLAYLTSRERRAVQAHLDQTKFDITSHVKAEAMIDQSVLMPEFFAPFPVSKGYVDVEIQFTPNKPEQDAAAQQLTTYDPSNDPAVRDHSGWMKKKGNTSHMLTHDYKLRWFELDVMV